MNAWTTVSKPLKAVAALAFVSLAVGCDNYTLQPVCNETNGAIPPGITGTYSLSTQNEDFSVKTEEYQVLAAPNGTMKVLTDDGEDEGRVCQVNGHFIQESYRDDVQGYEQQRLYVTGMGLTVLPVFYDKALLDQAGIPTKIFTMPESARRILGVDASKALVGTAERVVSWLGAEERFGLMIDNAAVDPRALMHFSFGSPAGLTMLRR